MQLQRQELLSFVVPGGNLDIKLRDLPQEKKADSSEREREREREQEQE
jgi:hypothetical protein